MGKYLPPTIIKLEHYQEPKEERGRYLQGLALDCYENPENDRNSHYFARELMWSGRPKSALKEFERHVAMNKWEAERSQSMVFMGDCYQMLGDNDKALEMWHKAYTTHADRREPLIKLAEYYYKRREPKRTIAYAEASLTIPYSGFYANDNAHYTNIPHEYLYWAYWEIGDKEKSKEHFEKAFGYQPYNSKYLYDYRVSHKLPKVSIILPHMNTRPEGLKKVKESIENLNYPQELIELIEIIDEPRQGVPKRVKEGYEKSTGDVIVFASDDIEFHPDSVVIAAIQDKGLVAFNTGEVLPDEGNINEHFMIKRELVEQIGEIFDTDFNHLGVDNLLWEKCKKLGEATRNDMARVKHNHFTKGAEMDGTYTLAYSKKDEDRALLKKKLELLHA